MKNQGLLRDRRFLLAASFVLVFSVAVSVARVVVWQDQQMATVIGDSASVFCALVASLAFIRLWLSTDDSDVSKRIWGLLAIGMLSWTVAETIWGYYEVILGEEVPYPSIADLFWIVGYLPFYMAVLGQYRVFKTVPNRAQKIAIVLVVILFSLVAGLLVFKPILEDFQPERLLESLINIAYPLFDLILLILTFAIIFFLEQGRFGFVWRLLGLGMVFMSAADLLFSYGTWNSLYAPDGQLNAITLTIDGLYYLSYLTLALAAYSYQVILDSLKVARISVVLRSLTPGKILVFIDRRSAIISASDNFGDLIRSNANGTYVHRPLADALGVPNVVVEAMMTETLERGTLDNQPLKISDSNGTPKEIRLSSVLIKNEQGEFITIALVLRTDFDGRAGAEQPLTEEQKTLVDYYLAKTGTKAKEESQTIRTYFLEQINLLHSLIHQFSGTGAADQLLADLNQVARRNNWSFTFSGQSIGIPEEYEGQTLADRLSALLQEAKKLAGNLTSLRLVEREMGILDGNLSSETVRCIDRYGLRKSPALSPA